MRERELKPRGLGLLRGGDGSLPMRERELKLCRLGGLPSCLGSLPMRERELKRSIIAKLLSHSRVAPHAGA